MTSQEINTCYLDQYRSWEEALGFDVESRQLSRGRGSLEADVAVIDELIIWRNKDFHSLYTEYVTPTGVAEICFSKIPGPAIVNNHRVDTAVTEIHFGGQRYDAVLPPGCVHYGVIMPISLFQRYALMPDNCENGNDQRASFLAPIALHSFNKLSLLLDKVLQLSKQIDADEHSELLNRHNLLKSCDEVITDSRHVQGRPQLLASGQLVDRALGALKAQLSPTGNVADLADELFVSRRTLERAFMDKFAMSPYQYMQIDRLHQAQVLLREKRYSVTDASEQCGFGHPGRFAQTYAQHFGELPSNTLSAQS